MMTFLAEFTKEQGYLAEAGRIVQEILPYDMDRVASYSVFEWRRAVAKSWRPQRFCRGWAVNILHHSTAGGYGDDHVVCLRTHIGVGVGKNCRIILGAAVA